MKTLAAFFLLLLSVPAFATWTMMIPEAKPGTPEFEQVRSIIEQARTDSNFGYQEAKFYTVKAETAFHIPNGDGRIEMYILVNGKYFQVPLDVQHVDNWSTWARRRGDNRGIFVIQRGHRLAGGVLWRVIATMKLTQLDGTPFSSVEYSEETSVEPCPECIIK